MSEPAAAALTHPACWHQRRTHLLQVTCFHAVLCWLQLQLFFPPTSCRDPEPSEVTSLCWSRNGRYLLSGHARPSKGKSDSRAADKPKAEDRVVLWDVQAGTQVRSSRQTVHISRQPPNGVYGSHGQLQLRGGLLQQRWLLAPTYVSPSCQLVAVCVPCCLQLRNVPMPSGVTRVCLSARKPFVAVVSLKAGPPVLVDLSKDSPPVTPLDGIDLKGTLVGQCLLPVSWCMGRGCGMHDATTKPGQAGSNPPVCMHSHAPAAAPLLLLLLLLSPHPLRPRSCAGWHRPHQAARARRAGRACGPAEQVGPGGVCGAAAVRQGLPAGL